VRNLCKSIYFDKNANILILVTLTIEISSF